MHDMRGAVSVPENWVDENRFASSSVTVSSLHIVATDTLNVRIASYRLCRVPHLPPHRRLLDSGGLRRGSDHDGYGGRASQARHTTMATYVFLVSSPSRSSRTGNDPLTRRKLPRPLHPPPFPFSTSSPRPPHPSPPHLPLRRSQQHHLTKPRQLPPPKLRHRRERPPRSGLSQRFSQR